MLSRLACHRAVDDVVFLTSYCSYYLLKLKFVKYLMIEVSNSSEAVGRLSQTNFYNFLLPCYSY